MVVTLVRDAYTEKEAWKSVISPYVESVSFTLLEFEADDRFVVGIKILFVDYCFICGACLIVSVRTFRNDSPADIYASDILAFGADAQGV